MLVYIPPKMMPYRFLAPVSSWDSYTPTTSISMPIKNTSLVEPTPLQQRSLYRHYIYTLLKQPDIIDGKEIMYEQRILIFLSDVKSNKLEMKEIEIMEIMTSTKCLLVTVREMHTRERERICRKRWENLNLQKERMREWESETLNVK